MLTVVMARSFCDSNAMHYALPVLWMTSCFHIMQKMCHNQRLQVQMMAPGGEVFRPRLHIVIYDLSNIESKRLHIYECRGPV